MEAREVEGVAVKKPHGSESDDFMPLLREEWRERVFGT